MGQSVSQGFGIFFHGDSMFGGRGQGTDTGWNCCDLKKADASPIDPAGQVAK
jgi:hypothetical protein